jgi:hypothetical protein
VATAAGVALANNYTWSFVTGVLNLTVPPMQQPGPAQVGQIRKEGLRTSPRSSINNDLHQIVIAVLEHLSNQLGKTPFGIQISPFN